MAAGDTFKAGPGVLSLGEVGSEIDVSCQVNSFKISASKEAGDSTTKLCGTVKTNASTYTYSATGNLDLDLDDPDGLFALSQTNPGASVPFTFTPSTEAGTEASGTLILDPMDFGYTDYGEIINSDVEWALEAQPTYSIGGEPINEPLLEDDELEAGAPALSTV